LFHGQQIRSTIIFICTNGVALTAASSHMLSIANHVQACLGIALPLKLKYLLVIMEVVTVNSLH